MKPVVSFSVIGVLSYIPFVLFMESSELTEREREVAFLISMGYSNIAIAHILHIGEKTVHRFISSLNDKLGIKHDILVSNRVMITLEYQRLI